MIEIRTLSKHFGSLRAVDDVSFQVERGEVLGFLGPNGAGKSTTMKMITGFLTPTAGTVKVCGHDVLTDPKAVKERIGYLPEGAPLYADMTPASFLKFIAEVRGFKGSEAASRIQSVAEKVQIEDVMHQRIETLSKGFKRRVGLAQAILHDPEVLILDEPTDGLDPNQKHEVRGLIREMAKDKVIVLSTHILEEVDAVCTRAMIIARGKLLFDGTPHELAAQSNRHNCVRLSARGIDGATAQAELGSLPEVREVLVEENDGKQELIVLPKEGTSVLGPVIQATHARGWELDHVSLEPGRLDEVFRDITTGRLTPRKIVASTTPEEVTA